MVLAPTTGGGVGGKARARVALLCWEPASPRPTLGGWEAHVCTPVVVRHAHQTRTPPRNVGCTLAKKPGLDVLQYSTTIYPEG